MFVFLLVFQPRR